MSLYIKPLRMNDLDTVVEMALEAYHLERCSCDVLPLNTNTEYIRNQLRSIIETGTGRLAIEAETPIGFLAFKKSFSIGNGVYGAVSPLFGYGVRHEQRDFVIGKLFQDIAADLCRNYTQNLRVNVYAHDAKVLWMYIMTSFAIDVTEVIKDTGEPIKTKSTDRFTCREVQKNELADYAADIVELYRDLVNHLRVSPVFYHCKEFLPVEARVNDYLAENLRLFAAFKQDLLVGMVSAEPVDIAMFTHDIEALCMGDVFIKPSYRGEGIAARLLKFANDELKKDDIKRLYVTHGTINPNARGFWDKHFTNYTYSMTRVFDKDMLGEITRV